MRYNFAVECSLTWSRIDQASALSREMGHVLKVTTHATPDEIETRSAPSAGGQATYQGSS